MEIHKLDEIILMHSLTKVAWAHTQEIILNIKPAEIRLFQVGTVHIMKGCK